MSKQKTMRGGLLIIIMMVLCIGMASATVYFNETFDTGSGTCASLGTISGGTCNYADGYATVDNSASSTYTRFALSPTIPSGGSRPTHTTSWIVKYTAFDSSSSSYSSLIDSTNAGAIASQFFSSDNHLYIGSQTPLLKSDFLNEWHSFDYVYNTTDDLVYVYVDGILRKTTSPDNSNLRVYEEFALRGYNYLQIDNVVVQDGIHINTDYTPTTCADGIDNDGDGFIDYTYDPDCGGNPDNEEDTYNNADGLWWTEDFTTSSSDCSYYDITLENPPATSGNLYACSVSSGQMNIGLHDKWLYLPFPTSIDSSYRKTTNYTISMRTKWSTMGYAGTTIYFPEPSSTGSSLQTITTTDSDPDVLGYASQRNYNLLSNLDKWIYLDFYHNASDNKVYFYIDGVLISSGTIENFGNTYDLSRLTIRNNGFGRTGLVDSTQIQIDEIKFYWNDFVGVGSITSCTDGVDNDGDTFIDSNDPDCVTGTEETNIDLYPSQIIANITIFEDDFDNANFVSEGWTDNVGGCVEGSGLRGESTILYNNDVLTCDLSRTVQSTNNDVLISFDSFIFSDEISDTTNSIYIEDDSVNKFHIDFLSRDDLDISNKIIYLPFDINANDYSTSGVHDAVVSEAINFPSFGAEGGSYYFDGGNDKMEIADHPNFNLAQSLSVMMYVNMSSYQATTTTIARKQNEWKINVDSVGKVNVWINNVLWATNYTLPLNQWKHLALIKDYTNSNVSFYVDGILVASKISTTIITLTTNKIQIGDGDDNYQGYIDEFYLFGDALTELEIKNYNFLATIHIKGEGICNFPTYYYINEVPLVFNTTYTLDLLLERDEGLFSYYLNGNLLTTINDSDCMEFLDNEGTLRIVSENNKLVADKVTITELNAQYSCYDSLDNDGDGFFDYPDDPDCTTPYETEDTVNFWQCNDGTDNDNDGYTDYPDDTGCSQAFDDNEFPKQGTACQDNTCSEAQGCILDHTFACTSTILNYDFTTTPDWYGLFVEGEIYNSRSVIGLHEFLGYGVITDSGVQTTDTVTYFKEYTSNTKEYEIIDNEFDFFFDYIYEVDGITVQNISNEYIRLKFYNTNYNINNKMFEVVLKPLSLDNEVWTKVYTVDQFGYEYLVGTMRSYESSDFGRTEFHVEIDTAEQSYRLYWTDALGVSDKSDPVDFDIFTYDYPEMFSMEVGGDPMDYSTLLRAENKMYLNNIKVYGSSKDTTTVCTEFQKPYYLYEEFNGFIENCGWSVTPENIYFNGKLYLTEDLEVFNTDKDFDGIYESKSRYATIDLTAVAYSYVPTLGYTLIETMDDDNEPVFAIYLSENDAGDGGSIGYYSDGDFIELAEFDYLDTQRIYAVYDFQTDTFKVMSRGQYTTLTTIGTELPIVKPTNNPTEISNLKIFSYRGTYSLDSIKIYTSDSNGLLVSVANDQFTEVFDPFPNMAGNSWCGYIDTDADTKFCSKDEECVTGHCNKAEGTCSGFDYTYCDEHNKKRGNGCVASAITSCVLETTGDMVLDNFFLVLIGVAILMFVAYVIFIFKTK